MASNSSTGPPSGPRNAFGPPERGRPSGGGDPLRDEANRAHLLTTLLDRTAQPWVLLNLEGRILLANEAFETLTGYSVDELRALPSGESLTVPRWRTAEREALSRLRITGQAARYELELACKAGGTVPVEMSADLWNDPGGKPLGYFGFAADLRDRKQAERALRDSEERFRLLYDEAPVGYHELDLEGRFVSVNRTECELLGYSREELLGRAIFDFMAEECLEESHRAFREKITGLRPLVPVERTYLTRDGRRLVVSIEDRLRLDDQGKIIGVLSTLQNISKRKQAEAARIASERRARALFEGIDDAIFVHDMEGRILDANPAACRRLGYSRDELLAMTTRDIDTEDFAIGFEDRLRRQLDQGTASFEGRHRTKDGRIIPVDINTSLIHLEDRPAILAVMRDISERLALDATRREFAEVQLRAARDLEAKHRELTRSEARYRQLTEGCLDAVVTTDVRGRITLFNPAAERTFGYPAAEVLGQPLTVLMPPDLHDFYLQGFRRYLETRQSQVVGRTVELRGRRKSGQEFPMELSLNAVDVDGELQFIGSIRDQAERQKMHAMLAQAERLATIGRLCAGVAHEINNPLAYVGNNLAVLERDLLGVREMLDAYESAQDHLETSVPEAVERARNLSEEIDWPYLRDNLPRMLARTRDGVQRVATIVQNLRGLARSAPPTYQEAALAEVLAASLEMIQGQLRRGQITVELEIPTDLPRVHCVATQVGQVLLNLLVNAAQAIESAHPAQGGRIRVAIRDEGPDQLVEVADNGGGITPEDLPHLFDPFYTTKPVGEGTGLGLWISHGIIAGHGGQIEVDGRPGQGACFRVRLPRDRPVSPSEVARGQA